MPLNPYESSPAHGTGSAPRSREGIHPFTALLIGGSTVAGGMLLLCSGAVFLDWLVGPPEGPGGPNIGRALLQLGLTGACLVSLPVAAGWLIWLNWKSRQ
jgi:hypothetical protein